jgi:BirA family biotin operon repressor/biotin-[acetyl-CoA-carboxylase] ligase
MTIILYPKTLPDDIVKITQETAQSFIEAINNIENVKLTIKYPNDILYKGKKLVGILCEMKCIKDKINYLIIGIGINVNNDIFPDDIEFSATSLKQIFGRQLDKDQIIGFFCNALEKRYKKIMG